MLNGRLCSNHPGSAYRSLLFTHKLVQHPNFLKLGSCIARAHSHRMSALTQKAIDQLDGLIHHVRHSSGDSLSNPMRPATQLPQATATEQASSTSGTMAEGNGTHGRVPSVQAELEAAFQVAFDKAFPGLHERPVLMQTKEARFGDYQCNSAMKLFNQLKGKEGAPKNPRAAGQAIVENLPATPILAEKPTLAGPGFVNLRVSPEWVAARIGKMLSQGIATWAPLLPYKRAIVDFSAPNVAKEMHVGHLRSTIIGDTIARTLEFCGVDTLRLNHIGDWGTQFGMLIQHISENREGGLTGSGGTTVEEVADLQALYRASKQRFDEDEGFKKRAREAVTQLQGGNPSYVQAWERICEASRREFIKIYERLGVRIQERGESFYNPVLASLVSELMSAGIGEESDGAKVIFVDGYKVPLMIQKSDGGFGYGTTDMAAIRQRIQQEKGDFLVYVTDAGQASHFELVFGAARKAGYVPADGSLRVEHVGFGVVLNEDGSRIKTRAGETVRLADLLDEAKDRCKSTIKARREERKEPISTEELERSAAIMGYAAVKYMDLKNNRKTDYKFSYDAMLDLKGNTAVYLLYAHARIASIVKKAETTKGVNVTSLIGKHPIQLLHPAEVNLGMHIVRFPEAIKEMLSDIYPNRITDYVYELSEFFSTFYNECQVVDSEFESSRLLLCEATAVVMRQCFSLLGITPLYRI